MWIRQPFLSRSHGMPYTVVHGPRSPSTMRSTTDHTESTLIPERLAVVCSPACVWGLELSAQGILLCPWHQKGNADQQDQRNDLGWNPNSALIMGLG